MKLSQLIRNPWLVVVVIMAGGLPVLWALSVQAAAEVILPIRALSVDAFLGIQFGSVYLALAPVDGSRMGGAPRASYTSYRQTEMHPEDEQRYQSGLSQYLGEFSVGYNPSPRFGYYMAHLFVPFWFLTHRSNLRMHGVPKVPHSTPKQCSRGVMSTTRGSDGDQYDWDAIPAGGFPGSPTIAPRQCHCQTKSTNHDGNVA